MIWLYPRKGELEVFFVAFQNFTADNSLMHYEYSACTLVYIPRCFRYLLGSYSVIHCFYVLLVLPYLVNA